MKSILIDVIVGETGNLIHGSVTIKQSTQATVFEASSVGLFSLNLHILRMLVHADLGWWLELVLWDT
jgi:hypothetical protein